MEIDLSLISVIVNAVFLFLALIIVLVMLRSGSLFTLNYGIAQVQEKLKWRILRLLVALVFLGLVATVFNLVITALV